MKKILLFAGLAVMAGLAYGMATVRNPKTGKMELAPGSPLTDGPGRIAGLKITPAMNPAAQAQLAKQRGIIEEGKRLFRENLKKVAATDLRALKNALEALSKGAMGLPKLSDKAKATYDHVKAVKADLGGKAGTDFVAFAAGVIKPAIAPQPVAPMPIKGLRTGGFKPSR